MFHLVHINLPFWELLDSHETEKEALDAAVFEHHMGEVHANHLDIVDDEGLESLRIKYPQARTV